LIDLLILIGLEDQNGPRLDPFNSIV